MENEPKISKECVINSWKSISQLPFAFWRNFGSFPNSTRGYRLFWWNATRSIVFLRWNLCCYLTKRSRSLTESLLEMNLKRSSQTEPKKKKLCHLNTSCLPSYVTFKIIPFIFNTKLNIPTLLSEKLFKKLLVLIQVLFFVLAGNKYLSIYHKRGKNIAV